jgi:hypothetical protein
LVVLRRRGVTRYASITATRMNATSQNRGDDAIGESAGKP